jgi:hypothetical protein
MDSIKNLDITANEIRYLMSKTGIQMILVEIPGCEGCKLKRNRSNPKCTSMMTDLN